MKKPLIAFLCVFLGALPRAGFWKYKDEMRKCVLLLQCALASLLLTFPISAAGETVADSQRKAVARYPDLARESSPLHSKFIALYEDAKRTNPGLFNDSNWPMTLAERAAAMSNSPPPASSAPPAKSEDFREIASAAENGVPAAQFKLGLMYVRGTGVQKNEGKAMELFHKAAEHGDVKALNMLGIRYLNGFGVTKNPDRALEWYRKAAAQGDPQAQRAIAEIYKEGNGVPKDGGKALEWFQKAAEQGDDLAQYGLAEMYENGEGVPKNDSKAFEWCEKAALQNHEAAQLHLGMMYVRGTGVEKNDVLAYVWMDLAGVKSGNNQVRRFRDEIDTRLTPEQKKEAQKLSAELFEKMRKNSDEKVPK